MQQPKKLTVGFFVALWVLAAPVLRSQQSERIMSWEEYAALSRSVRTPYILVLQAGTGCLLYFGAEHSVDPSHPQFTEMESRWRDFRPTRAFSEGGVWPLENSREQAIIRHGEPGFVRFLAARDGIPVQSLEPARQAEVGWLLQKFLPEQVKLFYVLRQVDQHRRHKSSEAIENYTSKQLASFAEIKGLEGPPNTVEELQASSARLLPELGDWRQVPAEWFVPTRTDKFTNRINREASDFRNRHMVNLLAEQARGGERVFAVVGFSHVVMQEPVLRAALQ